MNLNVESDPSLWSLVCAGSTEAFEILVARYQSLVTGVAYSYCGDPGLSEDVAQETFWTAWRTRESLSDSARLKPWLCGIARNLGRNAMRKSARSAITNLSGDLEVSASAEIRDPEESSVSHEEALLLWSTLERLPETYRESLVLFYREDQSVAHVAEALEISEDAVKQRLSRGRAMLRERLELVVEEGLRRSRPGRMLTVAIMAGITSGSMTTKAAAAAGAGGAVGAKATFALGSGLLGALGGAAGGLLGGWLGAWVPAQLAASRAERELHLRTGRRILLFSILFIAMLLATMSFLAGVNRWIAWGVAMVLFELYVALETILLVRTIRRLHKSKTELPLNDTSLRKQILNYQARLKGRVYRSRLTFLGQPLVDVNVSDPTISRSSGDLSRDPNLGTARGWIAIGDRAYGWLFAMGGTARALIALGGRAVGLVSFGGVAAGGIAVGGLAVGAVGVGGLGIGAVGIGGLAIGWQAAGGAAFAWDFACGGAALARHGAAGGLAFASDYAIGGEGAAQHFNDQAAKDMLENRSLKRGVDLAIKNPWLFRAVLLSLILPVAFIPLLYKRIYI